MLTGSKIMIKVYNNKEKKFLEYNSHSAESIQFFEQLTWQSVNVRQYAKLCNEDYDKIQYLDRYINIFQRPSVIAMQNKSKKVSSKEPKI